MKLIYLALTLLAVITHGAENEKSDITLSDGTVLKKAKILTTSPNDAVILHSDGIVENIDWDKLPADLRVKYGVTEEKQKKFNEEQKNREAFNKKKASLLNKIEEAFASTIWVEVEIKQVISNGILCEGTGYLKEVEKESVSYSKSKKGSGLNPNETVTNRHVRRYKTMPSFELGAGEWVFIQCSTEGLYEGVSESFFVIPNGTYSYSTALSGASKTVKSYMDAYVYLGKLLTSSELESLSENEIQMAIKRGVNKRR